MAIKLISALFIFQLGMLMAQTITAQDVQIKWDKGPDVPLARGGYFTALTDEGIWIAGGSYWADGKKLWTARGDVFDTKTNEWKAGTELPAALGYGVTAKLGKDMYVLGGTDEEGKTNTNIYRLRKGSWETIGRSPAGFIFSAYEQVGDRLYIFGGSDAAADVTRSTKKTWIYHISKNVWEAGEDIPAVGRQIFSASAIGKNIYVFGGVTQKQGEAIQNLDDAFVLDTETGSWSPIANLPQPMRAFWAESDGKFIYLIGGYGNDGLNTVHKYSPIDDAYQLVSSLPQPLMDTKFLYLKGKFYGISGEDKPFSRYPGMLIGQE